jgi:putative transposase
MKHYERRLPHWDAVGERNFVTFRLHGSLPKNRVFPLEKLTTSGEAFRAMDRLLDCGGCSQLFLSRPEIVGIVERALLDGERQFHRYDLHAYVVMPNRVHMLVTPAVFATRWLGPLKGLPAIRLTKCWGP